MSTPPRDTTWARDPLPIDDEPLIDIRGLAVWINVSVHTVRKWVTKGPEAGLLPPILRVNGSVRFRPEDVRRWLESSSAN